MAIGFKPADAKSVTRRYPLSALPAYVMGGEDAIRGQELKGKRPGRPPSGKARVTLLIDPAVVAKFKATGPGWQARMNDVLAAAKV